MRFIKKSFFFHLLADNKLRLVTRWRFRSDGERRQHDEFSTGATGQADRLGQVHVQPEQRAAQVHYRARTQRWVAKLYFSYPLFFTSATRWSIELFYRLIVVCFSSLVFFFFENSFACLFSRLWLKPTWKSVDWVFDRF